MALLLLQSQPGHAQAVRYDLTELEKQFEKSRVAYLSTLERYLPGAYRERFAGLSDAQMKQVADARRLWQFYTLHTSKMADFQKQFLGPIDAVGELLLIDPATVEDETVRLARAEVWAVGEKLMAARRQEGVDIDPTKGKTSPTGIAYPPLEQPHTCLDALRVYEESMVLAYTVASPEARRVLMENARRCIEIDVEEAGFVMYGNRVRMLTGTVAWVADPVTTACARDHSIDRKAGRASGHSSTVPGKEGFGDRLRRFGARGSSEGAGGGKTGQAYIRGLSYGGGHTGPLYSLKRNAVGPGRAGGAFTSVYYTDKSMLHDCQATRGELFLPPGVTKSDMTSRALRAAYTAFYNLQFAKAHKALLDTETGQDFDGAIYRYLRARLDAEVEWTLTGIERIADAGDVAEAYARLQSATSEMSGIPAFDTKAPPLADRFKDPALADEIKAGRLFRRICTEDYTAGNMRKLIQMYPESVYAKAAKKCIESEMPTKGDGALTYFIERDKHLNQWGYLIH